MGNYPSPNAEPTHLKQRDYHETVLFEDYPKATERAKKAYELRCENTWVGWWRYDSNPCNDWKKLIENQPPK